MSCFNAEQSTFGHHIREFCCRPDRQVHKHQHIVKHRHDIINEYDVIHQHDYHYSDVVKIREVVKHHEHIPHKPNYCKGENCIDDNIEGNEPFEAVEDFE